MLALEEWAVGRFQPMAMFAQVVAVSASDCHEVIQKAREAWWFMAQEASGIGTNKWMACYQRPLCVEGELLHLLDQPDQPSLAEAAGLEWTALRRQMMGEFHHHCSRGRKTTKQDEAIKRLLSKWVEKYYREAHLPMLERWLRNEETIPEGYREWFRRPSFVFFLTVAMPCWLEFHQTPWGMLLKARQGDWEALQQLLSLDRQVEHDPAIRRQLFRMEKREPKRYRTLIEGVPTARPKLSLKKVKFALGGMLSKWSDDLARALKGEWLLDCVRQAAKPGQERAIRAWVKAYKKKLERVSLKCRLNAQDIRKLFNSVAIDAGLGGADPDFNGQADSIYKRIRRNADLWPGLRETDIFRAA